MAPKRAEPARLDRFGCGVCGSRIWRSRIASPSWVANDPFWQEAPLGGFPDPEWLGVSGLERLRGWDGSLVPYPPISYLTEIAPSDVSRGHAGFTMPASPWFANMMG